MYEIYMRVIKPGRAGFAALNLDVSMHALNLHHFLARSLMWTYANKYSFNQYSWRRWIGLLHSRKLSSSPCDLS